MAFDSSATSEAVELTGKLGLTELGKGLMHSVIEGRQTNDGKLLKEAINQGFGGFVPDDIYKNLITDYRSAERLYGRTFVSLLSGYDADYVGRNIRIPEFQRELQQRIAEKLRELRGTGVLDRDNLITEKGMQLAALVTYIEELDLIESRGLFGEQRSERRAVYGSKGETRPFTRQSRYRDIAIRRSVKRAVKRAHRQLLIGDLEAHERVSHGNINIIYGIDASGSMKGEKIDLAKKAGIALAFKAIGRRDRVGLVVFSKEVKESIPPTADVGLLLRSIIRIRAARETDITALLEKAVELFPRSGSTNHLIILTDAMPTVGKQPEEETLEAAAKARAHHITISVAGINLTAKAARLAQKLAEIGNGKFYLVKNLRELDKVVLEDYEAL